MGAVKASELLLFNKKISAAEAFNRNLITKVIPDDTFEKETKAIVESVSKLPPEVSGLNIYLNIHIVIHILALINTCSIRERKRETVS